MVGKPQTLSKGQQDHVVRILRKKLPAWFLVCLTILVGLTGWSLLGIMKRAETHMERLVAKQFGEPRVQKVVREVATQRASTLMTEQIAPEVARFKAEVADELKELQTLVAKTRALEAESRNHKQSIQAVLSALQQALEQSQTANQNLAKLKSDIVEMQKCVAIIQLYEIKGHNQVPNPYAKEMVAAPNKLITIAISDPALRSQFITDIQGAEKPKT